MAPWNESKCVGTSPEAAGSGSRSDQSGALPDYEIHEAGPGIAAFTSRDFLAHELMQALILPPLSALPRGGSRIG